MLFRWILLHLPVAMVFWATNPAVSFAMGKNPSARTISNDSNLEMHVISEYSSAIDTISNVFRCFAQRISYSADSSPKSCYKAFFPLWNPTDIEGDNTEGIRYIKIFFFTIIVLCIFVYRKMDLEL